MDPFATVELTASAAPPRPDVLLAFPPPPASLPARKGAKRFPTDWSRFAGLVPLATALAVFILLGLIARCDRGPEVPGRPARPTPPPLITEAEEADDFARWVMNRNRRARPGPPAAEHGDGGSRPAGSLSDLTDPVYRYLDPGSASP